MYRERYGKLFIARNTKAESEVPIMKARRCLSLILSFMLMLGLFTVNIGPSATAANEISVYVDGVKLNFDQPPIAKNGRTLVPVRAIFEALGATVDWIQEEQAVVAQRGDVMIVMVLGKDKFVKETGGDGGMVYDLDVPAEVLNGRTLVPLRAVSEALDCNVEWEGTTQTVTVSSEKWIDGSNAATNGYIHNGVLYYSFIYQPYIYAYDGEATRIYAAGGAPLGIVVSRNKIYYINKDNQTISAISLADGTRETVFARLSKISDFSIRGDIMVIIGYDGEDQIVYRLDLAEGTSRLLYSRPDEPILIAEDGSEFTLWKQHLFVIDSVSPLLSGESSCKLRMVDTNTGDSRVVFDLKGTVTQLGFKDSSYTRRYKGAAVKFDQEYAWFMLQFTCNADISNYYGTQTYVEYYKVSLADGTAVEVIQDQFEAAEDISSVKTGECTYGADKNRVYRINLQTSVTETLVSGENYYYITNDGQWVVVLRAKAKGGTPTSTKGNQYAEMYVMDADGNHLRSINSYSDSASGSSPVGEVDVGQLSDELCAVCAGRGMVTCPYCRGTGDGQPIYVLGIETEQGCTYCGGTGKRLCNGCGGSGRKN